MRIVTLVVVLSATLGSIAPAAAAAIPDSDAPTGAEPDWLPDEEWVSERWLPFNETTLSKAFRLSRTQIYAYLVSGDRTLLDLAHARGVATEGLAERLVSSREPIKRHSREVLLRRTSRVLEQGHLAEHLLGHTIHHAVVWDRIGPLLGVTNREYYRRHLRDTPAEIAQGADVSFKALRSRVLASLNRSGRRGVDIGALSGVEFRAMRVMHSEYIDTWLTTTPPPPTARAASTQGRAGFGLCRLS